MAKKVPCSIFVGTSTKYFKVGDFDSLVDAKRYASQCLDRHYYQIIRKPQKTVQEKREDAFKTLGI
jgi:hypothetical protein